MSNRRNAIVGLVLLLAGATVGSGAEKVEAVKIGPAPEWAEKVDAPELTPTPADDVSYGYDYLLLQRQVNVREQAAYTHNVYRITSDSALQSGARLDWTYDPEYEQLTLHHLRVIRGAEVQERLYEGAIKTIQQERDLDRHLLNGDLTSFVLLEDIRVGDVIDYAYTEKGWNPTFAGRYFGAIQTAWTVPVRHQRFRLDVPAGRSLSSKSHGRSPRSLAVTRNGDTFTYLWEGRDLRPVQPESESPPWFETYDFFQFTEFSSWSDVVKWAEPLYALPEPLEPELKAKAAELVQAAKTEAEKTVAILQFVQQEVRYLGLELGAGSYRPNPPAKVLARRFGDCKDKTLLFCALMRAAGLTAYPALLHTDYADKIREWLPTPHAFDHVIAYVPLNGAATWVDPTLTLQEGRLGFRGLPDYRCALVIRPGSDRLAAIEVPAGARPTTRIEEQFDIPAFDQPAKFTVTTRFTGTSADSIRRYFLRATPEQITKDYVNYYASAYPGISSPQALTWTQDRDQNIVTSIEHYEVPHLWKKEDDGSLKAEFFPKNISDYAARPQTSVRSAALALHYPSDVTLTTTVNLPETWSVKDEEVRTEDPGFRATTAIQGNGKVVTMRYTWQTLQDHVPAKRMPDYMKALNGFRESLGYTLTYHKPASTPATAPAAAPTAARPHRTNWLMVLVVLITAAAAAIGAVRVWRWQPASPPLMPPEPDAALCGLRGWLWLVGFGVVMRPLTLLFSVVQLFKPSLDLDVWEAMTLPGGSAYQPALEPMIIMEAIGNTLLIALSVLLVPLFFGRKRAFPPTFITMAAFMAVFVGLDALATQAWIKGGGDSAKQLGQAIGQAAVWIPYMLVSRRVKATFTR